MGLLEPLLSPTSARPRSRSSWVPRTERLPANSLSSGFHPSGFVSDGVPGPVLFKMQTCAASFRGDSHSPTDPAPVSCSCSLRSEECTVLGLKPLAQSVLFKTNLPAEKVSWIIRSLLLGYSLSPVQLMNCNPPGSFVHGVFQMIILEWVAIGLQDRQCLEPKHLPLWPGQEPQFPHMGFTPAHFTPS